MGKYASLELDIYSIFDQQAWRDENISARPTNFTSSNSSSEFIRLNVIPASPGINRKSVSGLLLIEIFVSAGVSTKRIFEIADILDEHIVGRYIQTNGRVTQFASGSTTGLDGIDSDDPALYRAEYNISFNHFGVLQ